MKSAILAFCVAVGLAGAATAQEAPAWSFAIHGGAGVIERANLSPSQDADYRAALKVALEAGGKVLADGGSALDAVQAAIETMEDNPLFNAGRGAVFTAAGRNEMDASIMSGTDLDAGSVAGLTHTRHPIAAARAVMERSPHVMLAGDGADTFAAADGLEQAPAAWFFTERRWQGLLRTLREQNLPIPARPEGVPVPPEQGAALTDQPGMPPLNERKFGTVGAVALDRNGRLAAGTSTGGTNAKQWGRVGDAPIIGAGTYASNIDGCAVSATGTGEYFIRSTVARDICTRIREMRESHDTDLDMAMAHANGANRASDGDTITMVDELSPQWVAAEAEIADVASIGGDGGVIVMGLNGVPAFAMNTSGMYRGSISSDHPARVAIYGDEALRP